MERFARYVVEIQVNPNGITEKGWERFGDAVQDADLESHLHDEAVCRVSSFLPRDFPDIFQVIVTEEQVQASH
jgi:hypothetical protein